MTFWQSARQAQQTFSDPLEKAAQTENLLAQAKLAPARENYFNALAKATNVRAELEPERINLLANRDDYLRERLANMEKSMTLKARSQGIPYTSDKFPGLFQQPTSATRTSLQKVINAWPQYSRASNEIMKGAVYYMNAPGMLKKYDASTIAFLKGKASPEDEKILSDAGVSLNAMTELAETASRIMNIAKTNEGFRNLLGMVKPAKGETPKSYLDRLTATYNNQKNRYLQAEFEEGVGVPVDQDATKSRDNYVSKLAGDVDYTSSNDDKPKKGDAMHYTKEFKDEAKKHGVTPEQLHAFLASKGAVNYG